MVKRQENDKTDSLNLQLELLPKKKNQKCAKKKSHNNCYIFLLLGN